MRGGVVAFVAVLAALASLYLADPEGWGAVAFIGTAVVGMVTMALGPVIHRPSTRAPWACAAVAALLFLTGLLMRALEPDLPWILGIPDLWTFAGYGMTAAFLFGLLRRTARGTEPLMWVDTATITMGSVLLGWVVTVAPRIGDPGATFGQVLVDSAYPVLDSALLTLTVQLGLRLQNQVPASIAALTGMAALLLGDLIYTFIWAQTPGVISPPVNVLYMVAFASLGLMAAHPSMVRLAEVAPRRTDSSSRWRLGLVLLALLAPPIVPIVAPVQSDLDAVVRAALMAAFGVFVFVRLVITVALLQRAEAEAQRRATHDDLTGLPNRTALTAAIDARIDLLRDAGEPAVITVLLINIDHFKHVNETWGHPAGDRVLLQVARRLQDLLGPGDGLARIGGDEFVVWSEHCPEGAAAICARRVTAAFQSPVDISEQQTTIVTASIGHVQAVVGGPVRPPLAPARASASTLLRDADLALNQAKHDGRATWAGYDASMHERVSRRITLADALRRALEHDEIAVVYQPIRTGPGYVDLSGWEALVRWRNPQFGPVSPGEFIPVAEDTGLVVPIGAHVLREACTQLVRWQERFGRPDLHVSVNVSSVQLLRGDLPGLVDDVLTSTGLAPDGLWLEITESVVLDRTDAAVAALDSLSALGVRLSMDDFGTGYSSLGYLKDFPFHILKIDRSFVRDLAEDDRDRALTTAVIEVAQALGLEGVVAEGVETQQQADILAALGCSMAQGYLFGRPAPATEQDDVLPVPALRAAAAVSGVPGQRPGRPGATPTGAVTVPPWTGGHSPAS